VTAWLRRLSGFDGAETGKRSVLGAGALGLNEVIPRCSCLSHRVFRIVNWGETVTVDAHVPRRPAMHYYQRTNPSLIYTLVTTSTSTTDTGNPLVDPAVQSSAHHSPSPLHSTLWYSNNARRRAAAMDSSPRSVPPIGSESWRQDRGSTKSNSLGVSGHGGVREWVASLTSLSQVPWPLASAHPSAYSLLKNVNISLFQRVYHTPLLEARHRSNLGVIANLGTSPSSDRPLCLPQGPGCFVL
jgi:hypothetical protein